jgi:hypothetical protein
MLFVTGVVIQESSVQSPEQNFRFFLKICFIRADPLQCLRRLPSAIGCYLALLHRLLWQARTSQLDTDPCPGEEDAELFFDEDEVLGNLPPEQRAAYLAARADQGLALDDEVDEVRDRQGQRWGVWGSGREDMHTGKEGLPGERRSSANGHVAALREGSLGTCTLCNKAP